jgi:hypothetical protein
MGPVPRVHMKVDESSPHLASIPPLALGRGMSQGRCPDMREVLSRVFAGGDFDRRCHVYVSRALWIISDRG